MTENNLNPVSEEHYNKLLRQAASLMSKAGCSKGGLASSQKLTPKQRRTRARAAGIASGAARRKNKKQKKT